MRPAITGHVWPALPGARGALLGALLFQLARSERLAPAALRARQLAQLEALLEHARRTVPWYRERLPPAGREPLTERGWRSLPRLSRRDVQAAGASLRSTALPASFGAVHAASTSGSTGEPLRAWLSELDVVLWSALTLRDHYWHGRDFGASLASIRLFAGEHAVPHAGATRPDWGAPVNQLHASGPLHLLDIGHDVATQAAWLVRHDPAYLLTYPTNLAALLEDSAARGWRLPRLREVRTVSETVTDRLRARCREVWGVRLTDAYSSRELGYLALQCPRGDHYHVMAETVLVEVLDADDAPVAPGGTGRLVVTPLHGYAAPLIRYELDDHAEVGAPCGCGRSLPTLRRIVGRTRNMLVLPDGRRRWPFLDYDAWRAIAPLRQYQLVQRSRRELELHLAADRPLTAREKTRLAANLTRTLGEGFRLRFVHHAGRIPRGAGGKFEEFVSLVDDRPADG